MTTTASHSGAPGQAPQGPGTAGPVLADQAPTVLGHAAGFAGAKIIAIGLRHGVIDALADAPDGRTADQLAEQLDLDPFYTRVWCRGAVAAGICDPVDPVGPVATDDATGALRLAPHMATLLLDQSSPAYAGGVFLVLEQPEVFGRFDAQFRSGERLWWDGCSPTWIASVAGTGTPFYTRLIPGALHKVPGLEDRLTAGCRVVDSACGAGVGLVKLAGAYPNCTIVGIDGDAHSLELAEARLAAEQLTGRVTLVQSPLEEMTLDEPAAVVINNISMHECRDIDQVARQVLAMLEPGGTFVISDFPFPETTDGLRTPPGRIMSAIQFFEAQIDDQLLPRSAYDALLTRHGFTDIGHLEINPMHAVTFGRRPTPAE